MVLRRAIFFLLLFFLIVTPFLASKLWWLAHSRKASGVLFLEGKGEAGDQIPLNYTIIYFRVGKDTIWFNGLGNLHLPEGTRLPVRYQAGNPQDARVDIFEGTWGDTVVYAGIPVLMLIAAALHPDVVPRRKKVLLTLKKPYIRIV
jgi:hypothetical protein